jgi:hypothetical protein
VDRGLTPDEDGELRLLEALASFGRLSTEAAGLYEELRRRDRRQQVREAVVVTPARPAQRDEREDRQTPTELRSA